jgi:GDP-L-fucose synthase
MVGSALLRALIHRGFTRFLHPSSSRLDLTKALEVEAFFGREKPELVILAAARVGGILANRTYPAEFIRENLEIQTNVIHSAWRHGVRRLVFIGSSCIYPRVCVQPMKETALMMGPLEPTNAAFAMAKLAGIAMCQAYRGQHGADFGTVIPTNQYGIGDNFDPESSHLIGALIARLHDAHVQRKPEVVLWGSGRARRDFMHVDDLADAIVFLLNQPDLPDPINIGTGQDFSVAEIAYLVSSTVGYQGKITFDSTMPDGAPRKLLDVNCLNALGWRPRMSLAEGLAETYRWFKGQQERNTFRESA